MKHDLDVGQIAEPIEFLIDSKVFTVTKVTEKTLEEISNIGKDEKNVIAKQFSMLTGADEESLKDIDIRKLAKALEIITKSVTESVEKNALKAEPKI